MNQAPRIETATITGPFQIEIHWSTGEVFTTDLKDLIGPPRKEDPFCALHDPAFFAQGHADDWGDGLNWPGGLDLGADRLYALGRKQAGLPTREDFIEWMERNNLSLSRAAEAIGMTRRMIAYYKNGSRPIPKTVWLACIGYEVLERQKLAKAMTSPPSSITVESERCAMASRNCEEDNGNSAFGNKKNSSSSLCGKPQMI
ncbi:DUF2442 domain-containing protein [Acidithiobacillus ferrivorans]|uniref:DUF2442 domain-containing protein n=1 Tax=Acidithiobacillus ferrivorans TaxID=160808 RepID=UPI000A419CB9|nr:DUF2442 domain-containing protein [Acidithiobacillus ferrivorans]